MLAKLLAGILPPLAFHEAIETTKVHGIAGSFREVSLAHNVLLFLDEFAEFPRNLLELLRQRLEDLTVTIARSKMTLCFPASFTLIAAMNPCPCRY